MKVVGLCKTFSCGDFLPAILNVIYERLDAIVFVHSSINWAGQLGDNECEPVIRQWEKDNKVKGEKIHHLYTKSSAQKEQCQVGYSYIKENLKPDWIFNFDSDEVWGVSMFHTLLEQASIGEPYNGIAVKMHTYVKSPFYRVSPEEPCTPCVMVRPLFSELQGTRGNFTRPMLVLPELKFHHFSYVRMSEQEVFNKIRTSTVGDQEDAKILTNIDLEKWRQEKWDKLPNVRNFHTTFTLEHAWQSIEVVTEDDLPASVLNLPIIDKYRNLKVRVTE